MVSCENYSGHLKLGSLTECHIMQILGPPFTEGSWCRLLGRVADFLKVYLLLVTSWELPGENH